jgi:error-prone DNA polymerase
MPAFPFLRNDLSVRKVSSAVELVTANQGRWIQVAGLVLIRQRLGIVSGIVFVTIEDETGIVNLIIKLDIYDRYRASARHASLQADGYVERQGQVVHIMVKRLHNLSE